MGANLTNSWATMRQNYGLGGAGKSIGSTGINIGQPMSGWNTAGQAAGAGIGALLGNPLVGIILSQVGGSLLEKFFSRLYNRTDFITSAETLP